MIGDCLMRWFPGSRRRPQLAEALNAQIPDIELVAVIIGLVSAAIDNVPLVAVRGYPDDARITRGDVTRAVSAAACSFCGFRSVAWRPVGASSAPARYTPTLLSHPYQRQNYHC